MPLSVDIDTTNTLVGTDLDLVKAFLGIAETDNDHDQLLNFFVNAASANCNKYTNRLLKARDLTEYYSGNGKNVLFVNNYPINSITSLYDDTDRNYGSETEITSDYYEILPENDKCMVVYVDSNFNEGFNNIKIIYNAGYVTIPSDLQQACLEIIAYMYKNSEEGRMGLSSRNIGEGSIAIDVVDMPRFSSKILNQYRRRW